MLIGILKGIISNCSSRIAQNNYEKLLLNSRKNRKIKVVFLLYDKSKWKCKALYDAFLKDGNFEVSILITKYYSKNKKDVNSQSNQEVVENYNYFKNKNLNVELAYNVIKNKFISLKEFEPDVIIYQHPWGINKLQSPLMCSKFAFCYYIPYSVYPSKLDIEYNLDFYKYLFRYCVFNGETLKFYSSKSKLKNLVALGNPWFDKYDNFKNEEKYVIYAPHFAFNNQGIGYGAFEWSFKYILEFAKRNPELNWVFKPHPLLKNSLINSGFLNKEQVEKYYKEWERVGIICNDEDYLKFFMASKLMITDCGSFLAEYFPTKKPLIRLLTKKSSELYKEISKNYYQVKNIDELKKNLNEILLNGNDYMKNDRIKAAEILDITSQNASVRIILDIKNLFKINN